MKRSIIGWAGLTAGAGAAALIAGAALGPGQATGVSVHPASTTKLVQQVQRAGFSVSDVKDLAKLKREHGTALLRAAERAQSR